MKRKAKRVKTARRKAIKAKEKVKTPDPRLRRYRLIIGTRKWRKYRNAYMADHPTCELCGAPSEHLHHIVPLRYIANDTARLRLAFHPLNTIALCRACHAEEHAAVRKLILLRYQ